MNKQEVNHYTATMLLVDSDAWPPSLKHLYMAAAGNKSVAYAVERVVVARQALLDESGFSSELQHAVLAAANEGNDASSAILAMLRDRERAFLALCEEARDAPRRNDHALGLGGACASWYCCGGER